MSAISPRLLEILSKFDDGYTFEGFDLICPESHGVDGDTPLHIAAFNNDVDLLRELMPYVTNVDVIGDIGLTPLSSAVIHGSLEAAIYLLACGADFSVPDEEGDSALDMMKMRPLFQDIVRKIESR